MNAPTWKAYKTPEHAARAFVEAGKRAGTLVVLGGGWWELRQLPRAAGGTVPARKRLQGLGALARLLEARGALRDLPGGRAELRQDGQPAPQGDPQGEVEAVSRAAVAAGQLPRLEADARTLLRALGAVCAEYDSARTSAALGLVAQAVEELTQARIVATAVARREAVQ